MRRGEIWWASLGKPAGSAPGYRRPVLIVQSDTFNETPIGTVAVITFTSNPRLAASPGNVLCRRRDTALPRDSVANVSQLVAVDKSALTVRIGAVSPHILDQVADGLRLLLAL
ncbi:MAG: type II toxin-antitoxin system PemK/MazF family toxin [Rubrobacteraceae bacterium]